MKQPDISWCKKGGSRGWVTTKEVVWYIGYYKSDHPEIIPVGTEFESSVPRLFVWAQNPDDPFFLKPALVHDHLLEKGWRVESADSQWLEVAISVKAPKARRNLISFGMKARRMIQRLSQNSDNPIVT